MKKALFLFCIFTLVTGILAGQTLEWRSYLTDYEITTILNDEASLWAATPGGVLHFEKSSHSYEYLPVGNEPPILAPLDLVKSRDGKLWVGGFFGLRYLEDNVWHDTQLNDIWVFSLATDKNDVLWIGSKNGLSKIEGQNLDIIDIDFPGFTYDWVQNLRIDNEDKKWMFLTFDFLSSPKGLFCYAADEFTQYNVSNSELPRNEITAIGIDRDDNVWLGVLQNSLVKFGDGQWTFFNPDAFQFDEANVTAIEFDTKNNAWISTDHGLLKFDGSDWVVYNASNSDLTTNRLNSLCIDAGDTVWIGTDKGLFSFFENETTEADRLQEQKPDFCISPNPSYTQILFNNPFYPNRSTIFLIGQNGAIIHTLFTDQNKLAVEVDDLEDGLYFIQIKYDRFTITKRFVKQK